MFRWLRRKKRGWNSRKVQAGDGHSLKPYKMWHLFIRSLFHLTITNDQQDKVHYAIDCKYFVEEPRADLYRDGKHIASSKLPAAFPVESGVMEVAAGSYGIKRIHYVTEEEMEYPLWPDQRSIRGLRLWVDHQFPRMSHFLGVVSIVMLLATLVLEVPQLLEVMTQIPWVAEHIGTFRSPMTYSAWENGIITGIGVLAGVERTLLLRHKRLLAML